MDQAMKFAQKASVGMVRNREVNDFLKSLRGEWSVDHFRGGKLLQKYEFNNDITNEGKNHILEVQFHSGTQVLTAGWYIGLLSNASFTALAATDVMNSHAGWTEFTGYSQATRVAWGPGAAASQSITNSTPAQFDITGSGTVKGLFIVTNNIKSGTTGVLWATALFSSDVPVANGDQLKGTYTLSC